MPGLVAQLLRRKSHETWSEDGALSRCMNLFDLTVLGLGGMIDAGIYVVIGQLALTQAGPSVIISFLIAAVAALLAGLCYAELSARITKTGAAYVFTYVTIGELWAFIAGWSMLAECIIGCASMAKACSFYINSLSGNQVYASFAAALSWGEKSEYLDDFPDFIALSLVIFATVVVSLGVRESKTFMDVVMVTNLTVLVFSVVAGSVFSNLNNWSTLEKFAPKGLTGILLAAPKCFFCLSGFDAVPTASEEALDPRHTVPVAVILSLIITILAYFGISTVLTLMVPYNQIDYFAPLGNAFLSRGFTPGYYVVVVGAISAMFASFLASLYAASRLVYALAYDGLISQCFAKINQSRKVPLHAVIIVGMVIGLSCFVLNMDALVELVAIATICTYTSVAVCVLLSRYQADIATAYLDGEVHSTFSPVKWYKSEDSELESKSKAKQNYQALSDSDRLQVGTPSSDSLTTAVIAIVVYILSLLAFWTSMNVWWQEQKVLDPLAIALVALYGCTALAAVFVLGVIPQNNARFPYMVPKVIPLLSILLNMFVSVRIQHHSYVIFILWITLGAVVYFGYGFRHSTESFVPEKRAVGTDYTTVPGIPVGTEVVGAVQPPYRHPRGRNPLARDSESEND